MKTSLRSIISGLVIGAVFLGAVFVSSNPAQAYVNPQTQRSSTIELAASKSKPPVGASALCRDGSYSFSKHRSGTCSHHGGVRKWLR